MSNRWTVRGVDPAALALLRKAHDQRGLPMGVLITKAIHAWHASLTEDRVERRESRDTDPTISCDLGYPTSLADLLRQFSSGP